MPFIAVYFRRDDGRHFSIGLQAAQRCARYAQREPRDADDEKAASRFYSRHRRQPVGRRRHYRHSTHNLP